MINISLRLRITFLVGIILISITTMLTLFSIINANRHFVEPQRNSDAILMSKEVLKKNQIINNKSINLAGVSDISYQISINEAKKNFSIQSIIISMIIIFLGIGLTYVIMGRVLKPLADLSKTIQDINEHTLNVFVSVNNSNDEIGILSISFNKMIYRIKNSFSKQKYFAANVAHELKTPLATMKTAVQVLELDNVPSFEDYEETMNIVKQNVDRMIATVNDLFLLSSDEKTDLNNLISLNCLFNQIVKELENMLFSKNISCTLPEKDCLIIGNYVLIYSAFFNLFENAIKYNNNNGSIIVKLISLDNAKVLISIEDTGIGMTKEETCSAFNPFFRSTHAINQQIDGNGLGLSVVQTIINRHAGKITLKSKLEIGTKVTIVLDRR
ncbi:HAMP domain-containing histidine kinase [Enterococcus faecalis]|nr:HAMP domain-containing histidine kinase [Enterococcus faecalis]